MGYGRLGENPARCGDWRLGNPHDSGARVPPVAGVSTISAR
jgi:hypothetical protein